MTDTPKPPSPAGKLPIAWPAKKRPRPSPRRAGQDRRRGFERAVKRIPLPGKSRGR